MTTSHLTVEHLASLRTALTERRDHLTKDMAKASAEATQPNNEIENGDVAEQIQEQDDGLRKASSDATLLADINDALARLDDGTYGVSEESGEPIPFARLQVVPWARRTVTEEEKREQKPAQHV